MLDQIKKKIEEVEKLLEKQSNCVELLEIFDEVTLAGGAISSLVQRRTPRDWDFFFKDKETAELFKILILPDNAENFKRFETSAETNGFLTPNALSFPGRIQFVTGICGYGAELVNKFDFLHTKGWYTKKEGLVVTNEIIEAAIYRELHYKENDMPRKAVKRALKNMRNGWEIELDNFIEMTMIAAFNKGEITNAYASN